MYIFGLIVLFLFFFTDFPVAFRCSISTSVVCVRPPSPFLYTYDITHIPHTPHSRLGCYSHFVFRRVIVRRRVHRAIVCCVCIRVSKHRRRIPYRCCQLLLLLSLFFKADPFSTIRRSSLWWLFLVYKGEGRKNFTRTDLSGGLALGGGRRLN